MAWGRRTPSAQKPAWSQDDYHAAFAGKLKEQIEQGVAPWQKPWKPGERRLPENVASKKPYRGGNSVYLSVTQTAKGYSDNRWATYKQIKDMATRSAKARRPPMCSFTSLTTSGRSNSPAPPPNQPIPPTHLLLSLRGERLCPCYPFPVW